MKKFIVKVCTNVLAIPTLGLLGANLFYGYQTVMWLIENRSLPQLPEEPYNLLAWSFSALWLFLIAIMPITKKLSEAEAHESIKQTFG